MSLTRRSWDTVVLPCLLLGAITACDGSSAANGAVARSDAGAGGATATSPSADVIASPPRDSGPSSPGPSDVDPLDAAPADALDDAIAHYGLDWLDGLDGSFVPRASVDIAASADEVWQLVRDVNGYDTWTSTLTADAAEVAPGKAIRLFIQLSDPPGLPTQSDETIEVVDDARRAVAWGGTFGAEKTLRFQVVTEIPGGARYRTALKFPPNLGGVVEPLLGPNLTRAFERFAADLAARATESRRSPEPDSPPRGSG